MLYNMTVRVYCGKQSGHGRGYKRMEEQQNGESQLYTELTEIPRGLHIVIWGPSHEK